MSQVFNIKFYKATILIFFLFLSLFIISPENAAAEDKGISNWEKYLNWGAGKTEHYTEHYTVVESNDPAAINSLSYIIDLIGSILNFAAFLGVILITRVVWGGYLWMTAGGSEEQVNDAKKTIKHAVIGIAVIVGMHAIAYFITGKVIFITGFLG